MEDAKWLARYATVVLTIIASLEWLLGRTVSRLASAPMLVGTPRTIVEGLGRVGVFLVSPSLILALALVLLAALLIGRDALREGNLFAFSFAFYSALFAAIVVAHTLSRTHVWLNIGLNLASAVAVWWIAVLSLYNPGSPRAAKVGVMLIALAYTGWYIYVLQQLFSAPGSGGGDLGVNARDLGELIALTAPFAFFLATAGREGRWRNGRRWIAPVVLALLFSGGNVADAVFNQGFSGVFTNWSLGFNLIWPWPIYSVGLALFVYAVVTSLAVGNREMGVGLLLLLFAGYSLQIPYQHLLALLSLTLLSGLFKPFEVAAVGRLERPADESAGYVYKARLRGLGMRARKG